MLNVLSTSSPTTTKVPAPKNVLLSHHSIVMCIPQSASNSHLYLNCPPMNSSSLLCSLCSITRFTPAFFPHCILTPLLSPLCFCCWVIPLHRSVHLPSPEGERVQCVSISAERRTERQDSRHHRPSTAHSPVTDFGKRRMRRRHINSWLFVRGNCLRRLEKSDDACYMAIAK